MEDTKGRVSHPRDVWGDGRGQLKHLLCPSRSSYCQNVLILINEFTKDSDFLFLIASSITKFPLSHRVKRAVVTLIARECKH